MSRFLRFRKWEGSSYEFALDVPDQAVAIGLNEARLIELRDEIDALLNPPESVVQVSIRGGATRDSNGLYSYRDPSGTLVEGDLVRVPFGWNNAPTIAVVKKLGRGNYKGSLKDVGSRFVAEEL